MREFNLESMEDLLPETARTIASLIGFEATQALVERFGGVCFPLSRGERDLRGAGERRLSMLSEVIGEENTRKLVQRFAGDSSLEIPRCARALREWRNRCFFADVDALLEEGESLRMALTLTAPRYGFANTWAWHLMATRRQPQPQQAQRCLF
ncbi:hypothetical protein NG99_04695 [Erwinia typographi]|uniref:Mor transcription activator domain-containing protein n=1 Tax=Erwinia typographi TaxID=371042 RepID=A0A0A3Z8X1_9GAMM|nr:hypothetical protein [Erwinia typographi]KGT95320.1 hypothetical protein NG99_04695 [Erwinia typographi]